MKIIVIQGSPRMKMGNTHKIITPFLEGAKESGAEVEFAYLRKMKIQPCNGCLGCWFKTPGECFIQDDINLLQKKVLDSDIMIFATPVYLFSSSGYMKILVERLLFPLSMPALIEVDGHFFHPARYPGKKQKSILIANGAFEGEEAFKPLINMYEKSLQNLLDDSGTLTNTSLGTVAIGFSGLLIDRRTLPKFSEFFETMRRGGRELVTTGSLSPSTLKEMNRPLYYYTGMTREEALLESNKIISSQVTEKNLRHI